MSSLQRIWIPISALLISDALLLMGHGLLLTLLPVGAAKSGFSDMEVAFTGSAYFIGFVCGCLLTPYILKRVGHIRSFAVLATLYSAIILLFPWLQTFLAWMLLRYVAGMCISGLYMIIESWLNERADTNNRGTILSVYTMLNLLMMTLGQQLLNLGTVSSYQLFTIAAILISVAIIPVSLTLTLAPAQVSTVKINLPKIWGYSHIGLIGAIIGGLVTGAFWSLAPVYASSSGFDTLQLTLFMSAAVLGGAAFQVPLGKLSDHHDRRLVLLFSSAIGALLSLLFVLIPDLHTAASGYLVIVLSFLWGGMVMTQYAICLAHANDSAAPEDFVVIGSGMLFTLGIFSAIGAPIASVMMQLTGPSGLFSFSAIFLLLFTLITTVRKRNHELDYTPEEAENFQPVLDMTTPASFEFDPRTESEEDTSEERDDGEEEVPAGESTDHSVNSNDKMSGNEDQGYNENPLKS